jgi:hypothetical protein
MKKILSIVALGLLLPALALAQKTFNLQKSLVLQMMGENGTNGASVAYNPKHKVYYAAFAGNSEFPMGIFDKAGTLISPEDLTTGFDMRGLWFDNKTAELGAQGYGESGWVKYKLDEKGMSETPIVLFEGQNQPNEQAVGAFDYQKRLVYFLQGNKIMAYNAENAQENPEESLGITFLNQSEDTPENETPAAYNSTSITFTAWKGREFGVLNADSKQIELYDRKTGKCTEIWKLPEDFMAADTMFNFSFANNMFWIFDKESRTWHGFELPRP